MRCAPLRRNCFTHSFCGLHFIFSCSHHRQPAEGTCFSESVCSELLLRTVDSTTEIRPTVQSRCKLTWPLYSGQAATNRTTSFSRIHIGWTADKMCVFVMVGRRQTCVLQMARSRQMCVLVMVGRRQMCVLHMVRSRQLCMPTLPGNVEC